jgi:hypothetical protein
MISTLMPFAEALALAIIASLVPVSIGLTYVFW